MSATLFDTLQGEGWHIKPQVQPELIDGHDVKSIAELRDVLLASDLRKVGQACLPDDVNRENAALKGPVVLQVIQARDITKPEKGVSSDGQKRMMFFHLTDGRSNCRCVEYKFVNKLPGDMAPGTKIRLTNATVKAGMVLLDPKSIEVLGGRVDALAEAWEIERKYGEQRPQGDDEDRAPQFHHFDPRRGRSSRKYSGQQHAVPSMSAPQSTPQAGPSSSQQGEQGEEDKEIVRQIDVSAGSAPIASNQQAVKSKLLGGMKSNSVQGDQGPGFRGRGRGLPRGGRQGGGRGRGRFSEGSPMAEEKTMTLEEYEAMRKGGLGASSRKKTDEQLARELHQQLNMAGDGPPPKTKEKSLVMDLFSFGGSDAGAQEEDGGRPGGRGGRGRGGRGGGGGGGGGRGRGGGGGRGRGGPRGRGGGGRRGGRR